MLTKVNQEREVRRMPDVRPANTGKLLATMKAKAFDCCISAPDALEHKEIIAVLAERISQLPELQKKVLAMYYYENMRLSEIAALFGVTESRISRIRGQAAAVLRKYLVNLLG